VHPFVRRKLGTEEVTYLHPKLIPALERTLGIPVFQEQLMQMAMAVGECSGEDADLLRRAMGSKRGLEKIESLRTKLYEGMASNGLTGEVADEIYGRIQAFANFGFAESHSLSFSLLVYASSWLKLHYPGVFLAGLLRAQPMGFYSPATLSADARRHGVEVRRPDLQWSGVEAGMEPIAGSSTTSATGMDSCADRHQPPVGPFDRSEPDVSADHRRDGNWAVRLGLAAVNRIGAQVAERIVAEREASGPYRSMEDLVRRTSLTTAQLESLATAGAFDCFELTRREALWRAGSAAQDREEFLADSIVTVQPPLFADPSAFETLASDLWATGISTDDHPLAHFREGLAERGALSSRDMRTAESGRRIEVAGLVTHRQRPATASGITFLNLEDEHGLVNVICSMGVWARYRRVVRESPALIVRGILERSDEGVTNLLADRFEPLRVAVLHRSRDFQ
jgi:error-prone DNA polymerase